MSGGLFDNLPGAASCGGSEATPLAERMRPQRLEEVLGQDELLGEGGVLRRAIADDRIPSLIFWGPPGSGKTTLASIIAGVTRSHFSPISAVASGVADLRRVVEEVWPPEAPPPAALARGRKHRTPGPRP